MRAATWSEEEEVDIIVEVVLDDADALADEEDCISHTPPIRPTPPSLWEEVRRGA